MECEPELQLPHDFFFYELYEPKHQCMLQLRKEEIEIGVLIHIISISITIMIRKIAYHISTVTVFSLSFDPCFQVYV